jgi:hypothetical protein
VRKAVAARLPEGRVPYLIKDLGFRQTGEPAISNPPIWALKEHAQHPSRIAGDVFSRGSRP